MISSQASKCNEALPLAPGHRMAFGKFRLWSSVRSVGSGVIRIATKNEFEFDLV